MDEISNTQFTETQTLFLSLISQPRRLFSGIKIALIYVFDENLCSRLSVVFNLLLKRFPRIFNVKLLVLIISKKVFSSGKRRIVTSFIR